MGKLKVLDLFSGIGGFSLGLERAGMETVAFCEIDEHCQKVLKKHWPTIPIFKDIKKLKYANILTEVDVICGGFPCQDISVAGKQVGIKGERSGLWKEFLRLIKEVKPRYAIIENVANLRSKGLATVIKDLWKIGYDCEWHIISARSVGAPHLRERIWIIAYPSCPDIRKQSRWSSGENRGEERLSRKYGQERSVESPHAHDLRLWKSFASKEEKSEWWAETTASLGHWQETQSIICGVASRLSKGVERSRKQRIKQLGNSVVPQIPELIGRAILEFEEGKE